VMKLLLANGFERTTPRSGSETLPGSLCRSLTN
jgi:hypothetical protein